MRVDIWSDVVCPWCYVGKRRFDKALAGFAHADQVEVVWHAFELDPDAVSDPADGAPELNHAERLAAKFGRSLDEIKQMDAQLTELAAAEGLDYRLDDVRAANTFDAHRLLQLAAEHGRQGVLKERLFHAIFTEGAAVGDKPTLQRLAVEAGLPTNEVAQLLATRQYADEVQNDEGQAKAYGITGVPFFVLNDKYGVSGAQPVEAFVGALNQAWADQ